MSNKPPNNREMTDPGHLMHDLMRELFPICRSLTGNGVRETFDIIKNHIPLNIHEVPSGTKVFDWEVPDEWNIHDAYVMDEDGNRVIDFQENNLHVVSYSEPIETKMTLDQLQEHLHSCPQMPEAIPYVTSYYKRYWGFCLSDKQRQRLHSGTYTVKIDSTLKPGNLTYGELFIEGDSEEEILLSTYVCHPSMANNELSGPVLTTWLAKELMDRQKRPRYSYRIVFLPETIGAITYLSQHLEEMKARTIAGYVITCVGGPDDFTYLRSRQGDCITDRITKYVLKTCSAPHRVLEYTQRGSDERQYCAPGIDLPVGSLMRSKYHDYPEYHTSADDLDFVTPEHMALAYDIYRKCLNAIEGNRSYQVTVLCEPQLGKRGLYPNLGAAKQTEVAHDDLMALISYSDGKHDLIQIAELHGRPVDVYFEPVKQLVEANLLTEV